MSYIYKITNSINGKMYIGKTICSIEKRWEEHLKASRQEYKNRPLYDAFKKYGINNFKIEILEEVVEEDEELNIKEKYWIDKLRTYIGFKDCNGYNATLGGDGYSRFDHLELANAYIELGKAEEVAKKYHCSIILVRRACNENGIILNHNHRNHVELANAYLELKSITEVAEKYNCGLDVVRKACKEKNIKIEKGNHGNNLNKGGKKIRRISKNGETKEYSSITEAANDLFNRPENKTKLSTIITHLCGYGLKKKGFTYGYYWEYVE